MSVALSALGFDLDDLQWQDLGLCHDIPTVMFYEQYEMDEQVAKVIDDVCLSCPVMTQCLKAGMENNEWGTWGGIFLVLGKPDKNKNAHKTPEVKAALQARLRDAND